MTATETRLARDLWLPCVAAAVGLLPFTVYSTHLVPIAAEATTDAGALGSLRGLGGVAAFVTGVAVAPFLDIVRRRTSIMLSLGLLATGCMTATYGSVVTWVVFCVATGMATAVLTPALVTAASARYTDDGTAGRAATTVTAAQSLGAVFAGPVIGLLAAWHGWRGCLLVIAVTSVLLCVEVARHRELDVATEPERPLTGRGLARDSVAVRLIAVTTLRTAGLMGHLAYLAVLFESHFDLTAGAVTAVWTLSGSAFFLGNLGAGRWINADRSHRSRPYGIVVGGLGAASVCALLTYHTGSLATALAASASISAGHAVAAAGITTMIVRHGERRTARLLSVATAGMSLGVFAGAAIGGAGLALGGLRGAGLALAATTALAGLIALTLRRARPLCSRR